MPEESERLRKPTDKIAILVPEDLNPESTGIQIVSSWQENTTCEFAGVGQRENINKKLQAGEPLELLFHGQKEGDTVSVMYVGEKKIPGTISGSLFMFVFENGVWVKRGRGIGLPFK